MFLSLKSFFLKEKYRVVVVAICVNLMSFCIGAYIGWPSPVMPKLREQSADSPLRVAITPEQEGWISSLAPIGSVITSILCGSLSISIGRKWTLLVGSLLIILSYVFLILAHDLWLIYLARFLQGLGGGCGGALISMYVGEIATDDTRGALGSLVTIFILGGILYTYTIGPYVSYSTFQYCSIAVPILFFLAFLFMPETPYYFAIKGNKPELVNSLRVLRGKSASEVEEEACKIQKEVDDSLSNESRMIDLFRNRVYRKALFIVCGLLFLQQMSGCTALTFNSQSIFIRAGSSLDPALATIILGVVQMLSNLCTPFIIERAGRRMLLLVSSIGMTVALAALGTYFYIQELGNGLSVPWFPLPALILFNIFFGIGFGPIPWAILGEILPPNIKVTAISVASTSTCATIFVVTRWFPELIELGAYYVFWMFAGNSALAFFFVYFFVIETKGLSLQMIQEKLQSS